MNNSRWYVLQVSAGEECDIAKQLCARGVQTLVPIENRVIRRGGKWIIKPYILFPGYVFVRIEYNYGLYYTLNDIHGIIRILGGGDRPIPLTAAEIENVQTIAELTREPSVVKFDLNGGYTVISGALKTVKIIKMRRRQHRATAEIVLMGRKHEITLSFADYNGTDKRRVAEDVDSSV